MTRIALVTSAAGRPLDDDLEPLRAALVAAGAEVDDPDWRDAGVDWSAYDRAVIRSTWDYVDHPAEFLDWARRAASLTDLHNPAAVIAWNADKRYLGELAAAGARVVPTTYVEVGDDATTAPLPTDREYVVKPTVSVGSRDTVRYGVGATDEARARAHLARLVGAGRAAMVQPYQGSVDAEGETALLYFGGVLSHAIRKGPLLERGGAAHTALFAPEYVTPAEPTTEQLATADACLAALDRVDALSAVDRPLRYARVDVVLDDDGGMSILELELIEPSVFFQFAPAGAAARFAAAILGRAAGTPDTGRRPR